MADVLTYSSFDGRTLACRVLGQGRDTLLLHGFLADAPLNYIAPGIAAAIAATGRRVLMPDFRGHGLNAWIRDPAAFPPDVLAMDQEALRAHLGIGDHDVVGYSLGARVAVRMLARGARPRKVVLGGMGDSGVTDAHVRRAHLEQLIAGPETSEIATPMRQVAAMMAQTGMHADAAFAVLSSQLSTPRETLTQLPMPILVISGREDEANGSAEGLAAMLPNARSVRTPGTHLTAVRAPEFAAEIVAFLGS